MSEAIERRWTLGNNYLAGITAGNWWRLLKRNRFAVDPAYWPRAAMITGVSVINSLQARTEERLHDRAVEKTELVGPPLFILGQWRSGTSHLHNLLSRDARFAVPTLHPVIYSHSFLTTQETWEKRWGSRVPRKRPMDDMALDLDLPQEDEFALALTCLFSPYFFVSFPRAAEHYERYLTFEGLPGEAEAWKRSLRWFVKKLTFKHGRPLVLKSPPHTARIRLLLELFPEARFVHIHRNPYDVYPSFRHTYAAQVSQACLQRPDPAAMDEAVLRMYNTVFDAYLAQRGLVPSGRLLDVRYEELEARPLEVMRRIYQGLELPDFEEFRPALQAYLDSLAGYRKNRFRELPLETRQKVAGAWGRAFTEWNYPT